MASDDRISLQETADRLGVHYMTAYRYVRTGRLPATRDGVLWMVDPADVERLRAEPPRRRRRSTRADAPVEVAARMVAGDEAGAWRVLEAALTGGAEPAEVHLDIIVPALRVVGDGWADGTYTVADEHRASAVALRIIGRLGPRFARRGRKRGTVVVGAVEGDEHGLPSAILGDLLRGVGFEVFDQGANTPAESFLHAARSANRLVAVAISVTTGDQVERARPTVDLLHEAAIGVPILLGGAAISDEAHARDLGADGWTGHDALTAIREIEACIGGRGVGPT